MPLLPSSTRELPPQQHQTPSLVSASPHRWPLVARSIQLLLAGFCFASAVYMIRSYGGHSNELLHPPILLLLTSTTTLLTLPLLLVSSSSAARSSRKLHITLLHLLLWTATFASLATLCILLRPVSRSALVHLPYSSSKFKDTLHDYDHLHPTSSIGDDLNRADPETNMDADVDATGWGAAVGMQRRSIPSEAPANEEETRDEQTNTEETQEKDIERMHRHIIQTASGTLGLTVHHARTAYALGVASTVASLIILVLCIVLLLSDIRATIIAASTEENPSEEDEHRHDSYKILQGILPSPPPTTTMINAAADAAHPGSVWAVTKPPPRLETNTHVAQERGIASGIEGLGDHNGPVSARRARFYEDDDDGENGSGKGGGGSGSLPTHSPTGVTGMMGGTTGGGGMRRTQHVRSKSRSSGVDFFAGPGTAPTTTAAAAAAKKRVAAGGVAGSY